MPTLHALGATLKLNQKSHALAAVGLSISVIKEGLFITKLRSHEA
ncbi:MAG TPA: hypothetical protein V6D11_09845 [Waterburya sp.]